MGDTPARFNKYILLEKLFEGSAADVYLACYQKSAELNRLIVVKRYSHTKKRNVRAFKNEMKILMRLSHSGIVQFFDAGEEKLTPFVEMEYIHGKSLFDFLEGLREKNREIPLELALYLAESCAGVLDYVHTARDKMTDEKLEVVHRDLNPKNVMLGYDGSIKIMGFGFSKFQLRGIERKHEPAAGAAAPAPAGQNAAPPVPPAAEATVTHTLTGTQLSLLSFQYHSPEQLRKEKLDARSDLYSLGLILWEMLTGIPPEDRPLPSPSQIRPEIPQELDEIVNKALSHAPDDRFQTGSLLRQAIRKYRMREYPDFEAASLQAFARSLFEAEIEEDERRFQKVLSIAMSRPFEAYAEASAPKPAAAAAMADSTRAQPSIRTIEIPFPTGGGTEHLRRLVEEARHGQQQGAMPPAADPPVASVPPLPGPTQTRVVPMAAPTRSSIASASSMLGRKSTSQPEVSAPPVAAFSADRPSLLERCKKWRLQWVRNEWAILAGALLVFATMLTPRVTPPKESPIDPALSLDSVPLPMEVAKPPVSAPLQQQRGLPSASWSPAVSPLPRRVPAASRPMAPQRPSHSAHHPSATARSNGSKASAKRAARRGPSSSNKRSVKKKKVVKPRSGL